MQASLDVSAPTSSAAVLQPSPSDADEQPVEADADQPGAARQDPTDTVDAIQLDDPEAEKQLQQLLEGSMTAAQGFAGADLEEAHDDLQQEDDPLSPAGSRAMLKSRLWEQQVYLPADACKICSLHFWYHVYLPSGQRIAGSWLYLIPLDVHLGHFTRLLISLIMMMITK